MGGVDASHAGSFGGQGFVACFCPSSVFSVSSVVTMSCLTQLMVEKMMVDRISTRLQRLPRSFPSVDADALLLDSELSDPTKGRSAAETNEAPISS